MTELSKNNQVKQCDKSNHISWFKKIFCKHKNKTEIFRCYQDRYVSDVCDDCGKFIYSEL